MRRAAFLAALLVTVGALGTRAEELPPAARPPAGAAGAAGAAPAGAAPAGPAQPAAAAEGGPVQVQMKEVEIRGEVERPEVFYIIPRREARMELAPLSKDFREEIAEPLLPGPFEEWVKSRKK